MSALELTELEKRIELLNSKKNTYTQDKINNTVDPKSEKDMIAELIYCITDIRRVGEYILTLSTEERAEKKEYIQGIKKLNEDIKDLKSQILLLVNNSKEEIIKIGKELKSGKKELKSDKKELEEKKETKDVLSPQERVNTLRAKLRDRLKARKVKKEI